jgi:hypothetical protein
VFTVNIYAFLDSQAQMDPDNVHCEGQLERALCFADQECYMATLVGAVRQRMSLARGDDEGLLWIGETGWSSPKPDTLTSPVADCPEWASKQSFQRSYENFAAWDLNIVGGKGPDHVFYFTIRDSTNFGATESFGLIETCESTACKVAPSSVTTTPVSPTSGPDSDGCCAHFSIFTMHCCNSAKGCCPTNAATPLDCCAASSTTTMPSSTHGPTTGPTTAMPSLGPGFDAWEELASNALVV